jgi:hypothetical protein
MGYPSRHYPDSMANLYYNNNFYNNTIRERDVVSRFNYQWYIKQLEPPSRAEFQKFRQTVQQEICEMREMLERMQMSSHWSHRNNDAKDDYGIRRKPVHYPYVGRFLDDDVSHIRHVRNHIHKSPNRHSVYEENINYGEKDADVVNLELPSKKTYVQPPSLIPTTTSMEEQLSPPRPQMQLPSPQVQLITITTKIDDPLEDNGEVEDDINEEIVGGIFMQNDKKEKTCLGEIYVDFSKYISTEELCVPCSKENSRMSFFQVGVSDVGRYLPLFLVKTKIKKISIIILEECCLIRILSVLRHWKYKRKDCHDSR